MKKITILTVILLFSEVVLGQKTDKVVADLTAKKEKYGAIAQQIWGFAEMGYQEEKVLPYCKKLYKMKTSKLLKAWQEFQLLLLLNMAKVYR